MILHSLIHQTDVKDQVNLFHDGHCSNLNSFVFLIKKDLLSGERTARSWHTRLTNTAFHIWEIHLLCRFVKVTFLIQQLIQRVSQTENVLSQH